MTTAKSHDTAEIPGRFGLPVLGEILQFMQDPRAFLLARRKSYGPIFKTQLLMDKVVFVSGLDIKQTLMKQEREGALEHYSPTRSIERMAGPHNISVLNGERHKRLRAVMLPHFTRARVNAQVPRIRAYMQELIKELWSNKREVSVYFASENMFIRLIVDYLGIPRARSPLYEALLPKLFKGSLSVPIELPWTKLGRTMRVRRKLEQLIIEEIARVRHVGKTGCMIDSFLQHHVQDEAIIDNYISTLVGGFSTSSHIATYVLHFLLRHDEVRQRVEAELAAAPRAADDDGPDIAALSYLDNVIEESMRVASIVPMTQFDVRRSFVLKGHQIPRGWKLIYTNILKHYDDQIYPQHTVFRPQRFERCPHAGGGTEEESRVNPAQDSFGFGQHACLGAYLASTQIKLAASILLGEYRITKVVEPSADFVYYNDDTFPLPFPALMASAKPCEPAEPVNKNETADI